MTTLSVAMMLISMVIIWGGLVFWTWNLRFKPVPELDSEVEAFIKHVENYGEENAKNAL